MNQRFIIQNIVAFLDYIHSYNFFIQKVTLKIYILQINLQIEGSISTIWPKEK